MVEQILTGLALVKATPEKAYLSTTKVVPCSSFFFINGLQSEFSGLILYYLLNYFTYWLNLSDYKINCLM